MCPDYYFIWRGLPETTNNMELNEEFDGVFRFSNNSDEDFKPLWNNKEYTFPARTRSPIIIPDESLENIQSIRKKWAFKWAEREWFKSEEYNRMSKMGNGLPPTRQDSTLEPWIQMCLEPLPIVKAPTGVEQPRPEPVLKATKSVSGDEDLNYAFRKETEEGKIPKLGVMPNKAM